MCDALAFCCSHTTYAQPLPLNDWVHVALVLEPPTPAAAKGKKAPQAVVKGYIDGKV